MGTRNPGAIQTIATFFGIRAAFKRTPLYGKTTEAADSSLAAGEGGTDALGNIKYSPHGSASEQALVLSHERVHSFFSPRFKPLRNFRARKGMSAYEKSSLLRYAEEAMAETYAQWRVNGLKGIPEGIRFPISEGYVYITKAGSAPGFTATGGRLGGIGLVQEVFIGTIVIGGITYSAYVIADQVFNDKDNAHQADPETVGAAP